MEPEGIQYIDVDEFDFNNDMVPQIPVSKVNPTFNALEDVVIKEEEDEVLIKPYMFKNGANGSQETASWDDLMLTEPTKRGLIDSGYPYPSEIQFQAIPKLIDPLNSKDFLVQAHSGMGKTAIYLIALLELMKPVSNKYKKHQCIIVGNTRELPHQINKVLLGIARYFKNPQLRFNVFMGGTSFEQNSKNLKDSHKYPHILICSLGRLVHLLNQNCIEVGNVDFVVLDQCDVLLQQKDSRQDIHHIMQRVNPKRQLFMFTATLNKQTSYECLRLMKREHEVIELTKDKKVLHNIKHYYVLANESKKAQILDPLLSNLPFRAAIIFANSIERVQILYDYLISVKFTPLVIHSGMQQFERLATYDSFRRGVSRILISSDVSSRGVDFPRVDCVFNFDFPFSVQQFQHRAARTGRFGRTGRTISLIGIPDYSSGERTLDEIKMTQFSMQLKVQFVKLGSVIDASTF